MSSKKTHAREKKHTTYDAQKDIIIPLFAQYYKHTLRTKTHRKERKLEITTPCAFFFSSLSSFQRESCIHIPLSALKKKRERSSLKIHLSEKREFEILNIFAFARARERTALSYHRHKKEANKCRTRKKRPRRKR